MWLHRWDEPNRGELEQLNSKASYLLVQLSGQVRCVLQPLLPYPPMIGGISGSFIELPKFDFNLTGIAQ